MSILLENISCPFRFKIKIPCPIWEILVFPVNNYYLKCLQATFSLKHVVVKPVKVQIDS